MTGKHQVVQHRQPGKQFQVLESPGNAHVGDLVRGGMGQILVLISDLSCSGMVKSGDAVEHAGFSRPVGSDDGGDQSRLNGHVHMGQRLETAKGKGYVGNV